MSIGRDQGRARLQSVNKDISRRDDSSVKIIRMSERKKLGLLAVGIFAIGFLCAYLFMHSVRNAVDKRWNTAYNRTTTYVRNAYLSWIKDESPGVGPGNSAISPSDPEHFSFAVLGDTQMFNFPGNTGSFQKAINSIVKLHPTFVMTVGDLIQGCNTSDKCMNYKMWKNIAKPLLPVTYEVVGNHDRIVGNSAAHKAAADKAWRSFFTLPENGPSGFEEMAYSFDVGNSHFVVLDTEKPKEHEIGQEQLDWLEKDLSANTKRNAFVFYHEPAFPMSYKVGQSLDTKPEQRDALWSVLDRHDVTAVFNGHEHIYSREDIGPDIFPTAKNDIRQFIIGNTDATEKQFVNIGNQVTYYHQGYDFVMVDVSGGEITVRLFDVDGTLVDTFTFSK